MKIKAPDLIEAFCGPSWLIRVVNRELIKIVRIDRFTNKLFTWWADRLDR